MSMLVYVFGPDSYRRNRYVRTHLLEPYQKKYVDGTTGFFDLLSDGALARLKDFAGGAGLFAKVGLAVVSHPEEGEKDFIKFLKEIADSTATTVIIVADKKLTKDFAFLGTGKEFEPLSGMEFLKFVKAEAAARDLKVSDAQLKVIGQMYDGDTWAAMTEIERVSAGGAVEQHGVDIDAFGLIRTLAGSRVLAQQLRAAMLLIDYDEPAKAFNLLTAFVFGSTKIKMADYDLAVKSGKLEYPEALLDYVISNS